MGSLAKDLSPPQTESPLINHLGTWQGVQVSQLLHCYVVFSSSEEGTKAPVFGNVKHLWK